MKEEKTSPTMMDYQFCFVNQRTSHTKKLLPPAFTLAVFLLYSLCFFLIGGHRLKWLRRADRFEETRNTIRSGCIVCSRESVTVEGVWDRARLGSPVCPPYGPYPHSMNYVAGETDIYGWGECLAGDNLGVYCVGLFIGPLRTQRKRTLLWC